MENLLYLILITVIPGIELRGAIPVAIAMGENPLFVFVAAVLVNILLISFAFFAYDRFCDTLFSKSMFCRRWLKRAQRIGKKIRKRGYFGLCLFVAIPLPITGAYTGSLIAWVLGMNRNKSFAAIACGVIIAGILVTTITLGFIQALKWLI